MYLPWSEPLQTQSGRPLDHMALIEVVWKERDGICRGMCRYIDGRGELRERSGKRIHQILAGFCLLVSSTCPDEVVAFDWSPETHRRVSKHCYIFINWLIPIQPTVYRQENDYDCGFQLGFMLGGLLHFGEPYEPSEAAMKPFRETVRARLSEPDEETALIASSVRKIYDTLSWIKAGLGRYDDLLDGSRSAWPVPPPPPVVFTWPKAALPALMPVLKAPPTVDSVPVLLEDPEDVEFEEVKGTTKTYDWVSPTPRTLQFREPLFILADDTEAAHKEWKASKGTWFGYKWYTTDYTAIETFVATTDTQLTGLIIDIVLEAFQSSYLDGEELKGGDASFMAHDAFVNALIIQQHGPSQAAPNLEVLNTWFLPPVSYYPGVHCPFSLVCQASLTESEE